jgi:hypothetical protein
MRPMQRLFAAMAAVVLMAGQAPSPVAAADNQPPVAVDDPQPSCLPADLFGGSFPIPEDWIGSDPNYPGWFPFYGHCLPTANDYDPDGDSLTPELVGQPDHGEAEWTTFAPELLLYRRDPDWSTLPGDQPGGSWVSDEIRYRVSDGQAWSNTASFRIWIAPVNDPPTFTPGAATVEAIAYGDPVSTPWATGISAGPANEAYQHVALEVVTDTRNAPAMFSVPPSIDADGVLTFTPGTEAGLAEVTVTARDDGGLEDWGLSPGDMPPPDDTSDPVTFSIIVWPPAPAPPDAVDDELTVPEDGAATVDVLANDYDRNGEHLLVTGFSQPSKGAVDWAPGPSGLVYTANPDATGSDSFTYTVIDTTSEATATVQVTIEPANDQPTAADDTATIAQGAGHTVVDVLANDADIDGDMLTVSHVGTASHGTATLDGGVVRYGPDAGFSGSDTFGYTIEDGHGGTATAQVVVTVSPDVMAPVVATPVTTLAMGRIGSATVPVRLSWSATDDGSGVTSYTVEERRGDGTWTRVTLPSPLAVSLRRTVTVGETIAWRVRARDGSGNESTWRAAAPVVPVRLQETTSAATWRGSWTTAWNRELSAGRDRWTSGTGRSVTLAFAGREVAWVGRTGPGGGTADIWIDGKPAGTIASRSDTPTYRVVRFNVALAPGPHRLQVRPRGDGRVDVDAFVILR